MQSEHVRCEDLRCRKILPSQFLSEISAICFSIFSKAFNTSSLILICINELSVVVLGFLRRTSTFTLRFPDLSKIFSTEKVLLTQNRCPSWKAVFVFFMNILFFIFIEYDRNKTFW